MAHDLKRDGWPSWLVKVWTVLCIVVAYLFGWHMAKEDCWEPIDEVPEELRR